MRWLSCLVIGLCLHGCALLTVSGAPERHQELNNFECSTDNGAVLGDVSWAVFDALMFFSIMSANNDEDPATKPPPTGLGVIFGVIGALHAVSGVYGYATVSGCRSAQAAARGRAQELDAAQQARIAQLEGALGVQAGVACSVDTECGYGRICQTGRCVAPTQTPAAPSTQPQTVPIIPVPQAPGTTPAPSNPPPIGPEPVPNTMRPMQPGMPGDRPGPLQP